MQNQKSGKRRIPSDSWSIVEKVLRRYPEQKREYENMREQILEATPYCDGQPRGNYPANRPESTAIKLQSPRMQRLEREITAVERAYGMLREEQKKVIRIRYWSYPWRNVPYLEMREVAYSERQMHRIVFRVVDSIARDLGEII